MGCNISYSVNICEDLIDTTLVGKYTPYMVIQPGKNKIVVRARVSGESNQHSVVIKKYSKYTELEALRELEVLQKVQQHNNFVKLVDSFSDSFDNTYIVLSGNNTTDLFNFTNELRVVPEDLLLNIFHQVVNALHFMHKNLHLAHGDISPENIVIDRTNNHTFLIDFADSVACSDSCFSVVNKHRGKVAYMSPELYHLNSENPLKSDIWSLGISLVTCVTCTTLFEIPDIDCDRNFYRFRLKLKNNKLLSSSYSQALGNLLQLMLRSNPEKRLSIDQVKSHQWFGGKE